MSYTLRLETIDEEWFSHQITLQAQRHYKSVYAAEVSALQDFYNKTTTTEQAAKAITKPISNAAIEETGDYSSAAVALCQLWSLFENALIEWPSSRTPDLIALMVAMSKVEDLIHQGKATDDDEKPLSWERLPFFHMVWSDAFWRTPGQIVRQCTDETSKQHERDVYIKQQDVEARLVAVGIFECNSNLHPKFFHDRTTSY